MVEMSQDRVIAIVDDDTAIREALQDLLRSFGYRTEAYTSAEEFLAGCSLSRVQCLILDVMMPGLSGLELQQTICSSGSVPPVIFMTSHNDERTRSAAMRAGAHDFLGKPVDADVLIKSLRSALRD